MFRRNEAQSRAVVLRLRNEIEKDKKRALGRVAHEPAATPPPSDHTVVPHGSTGRLYEVYLSLAEPIR